MKKKDSFIARKKALEQEINSICQRDKYYFNLLLIVFLMRGNPFRLYRKSFREKVGAQKFRQSYVYVIYCRFNKKRQFELSVQRAQIELTDKLSEIPGLEDAHESHSKFLQEQIEHVKRNPFGFLGCLEEGK